MSVDSSCPSFSTLDHLDHSPDLVLLCNDAKNAKPLPVPVHREHLCRISNYFKTKIETATAAAKSEQKSSIEIAVEYDVQFNLDLIRFYYTTQIEINETSIVRLYTHAAEWSEKLLLQKCLEYIERTGFRSCHQFLRFPPDVRDHINQNVRIDMNTVERLLPAMVWEMSPLYCRLEEFILLQIGTYNLYQLWKWCTRFDLKKLTKRMISHMRTEMSTSGYVTVENFFPIATFWAYVEDWQMFKMTMKSVDNFQLDHFLTQCHHWIDNCKPTSQVTMVLYAELWIVNPNPVLRNPEFDEFRLKLQQKIIDVAKNKFQQDENGKMVKISTIKRYLEFRQLFEEDEMVCEWFDPVEDSLIEFVENRYHWPNGTSETYQELKQLLEVMHQTKTTNTMNTLVEIVKLIFFDNAIQVIEEKLAKVDSFGQRKEFYDYLKLLFPFKPRELEVESVKFSTLPLGIKLELYEHTGPSLQKWLLDKKLANAIVFDLPVEMGTAEFKALYELAQSPNDSWMTFELLQKCTKLTTGTVFEFYQLFGIQTLEKIREFIIEELDRGTSEAFRTFNTLSESPNHDLFDPIMGEWVKNGSINHTNFELKLRVAKHFKLDLDELENRFIGYIKSLPPADDLTVWRQWFRPMFDMALQNRLLLLVNYLIRWLFIHLDKECNPNCTATVNYYDFPHFYKAVIGEDSVLDSLSSEILNRLSHKPVEWYKEFVDVERGDLRRLIETKLTCRGTVLNEQDLRLIWEIAENNQRFEDSPELRANLEQRLRKHRNPAKRFKMHS